MIRILDMPEAADQLGAWLDRQIASDSLAVIVDELSAIHGATEELLGQDDARAWLGDDAEAVCQRGLGALSRDRLRELLRRPALLSAIQELVLLEGDAYWDRHLEQVRVAPYEAIAQSVRSTPATIADPASRRNARRFLFAAIPLGLAASLGLLIFKDAWLGDRWSAGRGTPIMRGVDGVDEGDSPAQHTRKWGWNSDELIPSGLPASRTPAALAAALDDWFGVTRGPDIDAKLMLLRLSELWTGCDRVLELPLEDMEAPARKRVYDVAATLQAGLQATLKELRDSTTRQQTREAVDRAKKTADTLVREAMDSLSAIQ